MSKAALQKEMMDHAMRVLWALVEREGGTITVSAQEAGPITGAINVIWDHDSITVSVGAGPSAVHQ